eukprot:TRINITY_DN416_c0_g1_i1.p1 TRINITY_DN416_c0_g1~~TRINITY_DN416_c0_g1_i1.p1  ORF type:complete len:231 (-),score=83.29 TRINITY_DN416_c0_g1_i1:108-800(-)
MMRVGLAASIGFLLASPSAAGAVGTVQEHVKSAPDQPVLMAEAMTSGAGAKAPDDCDDVPKQLELIPEDDEKMRELHAKCHGKKASKKAVEKAVKKVSEKADEKADEKTSGRMAPYADFDTFGRQKTAQKLTEDSVSESNRMVDQIEKAEVAEEKRSVFRALTHLRGAAIAAFDGIARSHTANMDAYTKKHQWRQEHPVKHLAESEADVAKWAFPENADMLIQLKKQPKK